jgi:HlyD family secretion protein
MRNLWNRMKELVNKNRKVSVGMGIVLLVVVIVALIYSGRSSSTNTTYQTEKVARGNLVATIGATGTVRARQSASLVWQTSGTVDAVNANVGDQVKKDAVLASLSKSSVSQSVILAEADLVSAQKALDDVLNSDTARAQALIKLKDAEDAYENAYDYRESLNGKVDLKDVVFVNIGGQSVPRVKYYRGYADEETKAAADDDLALKKGQYEDAKRAYDRLKDGPNPEDVAAAQARVDAAQTTLNMARIAAPFDGTITQAEPSVGDQVSTGTVAFRIDDLSHLLVDLQVSEVDINNVTIGQSATLSFDAILGKEYHGKVVEVGQAGDTVQGVVNFIVMVELTDADELVKPGMTAAVSVVIEEQKDVILIPNRAVRLINEERVIYTLVNNQPKPVKIKLGVTDGTNSALVGGDLKEGDEIILNPPSMMGGPFGG